MKQAYLIIAHKDDLTFRTLISMLDNENNDIFIHMDKKSKNYDEESIEKMAKKSIIYHTERSNVAWGGYSLVNAEMILLRKATEVGHYNHYHLLSGQDLPIQSQETIQKFFLKNSDKEFAGFDKDIFTYGDRVYYRYFFQELAGKRKSILKSVDKFLLKMQKKLNIKRNENIEFQKGAQWFSITDGLARYVLSKDEWIKNVFKNGFCVDEVFLQTIIINSDYTDKLYYSKSDGTHKNTMRLVDWSSGSPHVFRYDDLDDLRKSDLMFARKFDCAVDERIIQKIYEIYAN